MSVWLNPKFRVCESLDDELNMLVIGGGGWIGLATLDMLHALLGEQAFRRRVTVLGSSRRRLEVNPGLSVECEALASFVPQSAGPTLVFYYSFLTKDKVKAGSIDQFVAINRSISDRVHDLVGAIRPRAVVLPSSGAVYAAGRRLETDLERNPYGALKVVDESRFQELMARLGGQLVVPRIFGLSGEYINKHDAYALAGFIKSVQSGSGIEIRARHDVFRSYMYIGDLVGLTLQLALAAKRGSVVFDTAGDEVVEIEELAQRVAQVLGHPSLAIRRTREPSLPADRYVGDPVHVRRLMAAADAEQMPLDTQILRTASHLGSES